MKDDVSSLDDFFDNFFYVSLLGIPPFYRLWSVTKQLSVVHDVVQLDEEWIIFVCVHKVLRRQKPVPLPIQYVQFPTGIEPR